MQMLLILEPICMHFLPPHHLKRKPLPFSLKCTSTRALQLHHHYIPPPPHHHHYHLLNHCLMGRPPCCDKLNVKRGLWTPEEDAKILAYVSDHGTGNWTLVPKKAGLNRCGKSCRLRWTNYLRPDLKHDNFTSEEEEHIINLHKAIGSRWSLIAKQLPGRTDNDVKNYWNTKLRKKLSKMGIDPVTHKPFSQILSDYGNISGLANAGNHFGRNIHNNMLISKSESSSIILNDDEYRSSKNILSMKQPRTGPVQSSSSTYSNPSWDFFPTNQEINSSCSSPSSSTITQLSSTMQSHYSSQAQIITPSSPFSWSEFLLCDPISSPDFPPQLEPEHDQGQGRLPLPSSTNSTALAENETYGCQTNSNYASDQVMMINTNADATSSSGSSFVDAILCQDSEMSSQLFQLLDGSFD